MADQMVDITLHIDEDTSNEDREKLRDKILGMDGTMAAAYHDEKPHLMVIEYDPNGLSLRWHKITAYTPN
jgi:hypothetical protein